MLVVQQPAPVVLGPQPPAYAAGQPQFMTGTSRPASAGKLYDKYGL